MRLIFLILLFTVTGCRKPEEDAGLRKKYEDQLAELGELQKKLEEIRKMNAELETPDPTGDLAEIKKQVAGLTEEKEALQEKATELKAEVEAARKHLAEYREKYPLRQD